MKQIAKVVYVIFLCACGIIASSCSAPNRNKINTFDPAGITNPADSLLKKQVEAEVDSINKGVADQGKPYRFEIPINDQKGSVDYWVENGKPSRVSLQIASGENMIWPTYFLRKDELQMVRFRSRAEKESGPYAFEHMIYFRDGIIFFCEERQMDLLPGEIPGLLRDRPFAISTKTFGELEKEYAPYWEIIKPAVKEHWENLQSTGKQ